MGSALSQPPVTFEQQPNVGGLGIMDPQNGPGSYYQQANNVSRVHSRPKLGTDNWFILNRCDLACLPDTRRREDDQENTTLDDAAAQDANDLSVTRHHLRNQTIHTSKRLDL